MERRVAVVLVGILVAVGGSGGHVAAQDPVTVGPDIYKCPFENAHTRLCEVTFKPGAKIGMHAHRLLDGLVFTDAAVQRRIETGHIVGVYEAPVGLRQGRREFGAECRVRVGRHHQPAILGPPRPRDEAGRRQREQCGRGLHDVAQAYGGSRVR